MIQKTSVGGPSHEAIAKDYPLAASPATLQSPLVVQTPALLFWGWHHTLFYLWKKFSAASTEEFSKLVSPLMGDPTLENVNSPSLETFHQMLKVLGWEGGGTRPLLRPF